jgi:hypothetical protein
MALSLQSEADPSQMSVDLAIQKICPMSNLFIPLLDTAWTA